MLRRPPRSTLFPTRRSSDPHCTGDELQERPAPGLVEFVEPARQLLWQLGLAERAQRGDDLGQRDRKSTRLNSSHMSISYAVFCLKKKKNPQHQPYFHNTSQT